MPTVPRCGNCLYFGNQGKVYDFAAWKDGDGGECRRYPPKDGRWPVLMANECCGEWKAKAVSQ